MKGINIVLLFMMIFQDMSGVTHIEVVIRYFKCVNNGLQTLPVVEPGTLFDVKNAGENKSEELQDLLLEMGVNGGFSAPREQYQNGATEKAV